MESIKEITDRLHYESVKPQEYTEDEETFKIWVAILSRIGGMP